MIEQIDNTNPYFARKIYEIFQASYPVEANLIGVELADFPPMQRTQDDFLQSDTSFYAKYEGDEVVAVMELRFKTDALHIQSLVVHPEHFRKGIGAELIDFSFRSYPVSCYTVETGAANDPAIALYEKMGFEITETYMTAVGIEKVKMKKQLSMSNEQ